MTAQQNRLFYALLSKLGLTQADKEALVWSFTNKRTDKSSEMTLGEAREVLRYLKERNKKLEAGSQRSEARHHTSVRLLKKIKSYGVKCSGYKHYETDIDWAGRVVPYICKVAQKQYWGQVTRLDNKSLIKILYQLEKIYEWQCKKGFEAELDEILKELNISKYDGSANEAF